MSNFKLLVATPHKVLFDNEAQSIVCKNDNGEFAILAGYENMITATTPTKVIIIDSSDKEHEFFASGGIMEVLDGEVSLCVDTIETREEIDLTRAELSKKESEENLKSTSGNKIDDMLLELSLNRAIGRIEFKKNK